MRRYACVLFVAAALASCGDSIDPTPERQDGSQSREFEPDDIERAKSAQVLVRVYCAGAASEAQEIGCRSHVTVQEVCEQDTEGKTRAVEEYGSEACE